MVKQPAIDIPARTLRKHQKNGFIIRGCITLPNTLKEAKIVKALMWPTLPMIKGAIQQPIRNPAKWLDPNRPNSTLVKPISSPANASKGANILDPNWRKKIEISNARKDITNNFFALISCLKNSLPNKYLITYFRSSCLNKKHQVI